VYAVCWNDMPMLPYFIRHYRPLGARFHLFDDGSTDGTLEYLRAQPDVDVAAFDYDGRSFELSAVALYDEVWKRSRGEADWVVICDVDEHMYNPDLAGYLDRSREQGVTAIEAVGYQMITDSFPRTDGRLCDEFVNGARWRQMDKLAIFDPTAIRATNYGPGRHRAKPKGRVVFPRVPEVKLLHYRYLGLDYVRRRNRELAPRFGPVDLKHNFGHKYRWDDEALRADFDRFAALSEPVV
jgi:glycosyltransferase involved in cell wall biosynthesis